MKYLVRCGKYIGDTLMQFPALRHLARQGHDVWVLCPSGLEDLFNLVGYARYTAESFLQFKHDRYLDLQLYPDRIRALRLAGAKPVPFMYGMYPDTKAAAGDPIVFDTEPRTDLASYRLPKEYDLVSPYGRSQEWKPEPEWMVLKARELFGARRPLYVLSDKEDCGLRLPTLRARRLADLPALIRGATNFFTTNSSPSIFASAVRKSYHHLHAPDADGTHDWESPGQVVVYHEGWPVRDRRVKVKDPGD